MRAGQLLCAGAIAFALIGCQDNKSARPPAATRPAVSADALLAQKQQREPAAPGAPEAGAQGAGDAPAGPPDDLALLVQKTQAHARRVTEEMHRNGTLEQAAGRQPPPSVVEWMDDSAFRMGIAQAARAATTPPAADRPPAPAPGAAPAPEAGTANKAVSIEDDAPAAAAPQVAMLTTPLPAIPPAAVEGGGSALERKLEKQVRDYPKDLAGQLDYQLYLFVQGKPAPDLSKLAALADEDQEILNALLDALTNFRGAVQSDANLLLGRKIKPLMDLADRLRARADLEVPVVELCKRVDGYGIYDPVEHRFIAGQDRDIIVYAEVENFMSQFNDKSQWETRLSEEVVLYTDTDGLPVLRDKPTPVPDSCRNRRSDFFIVRRLRLPATIPVGRYWLKVTVVDQLASRVAEHSIPLTFVAK
jgi:hypothetical protein